ncbi:hypothetical protein CANARDRAFT_29652 [[Candida] arabinofermentans NRRL YB-2248]|uniref:Uncharacterized protein n=1 Tax=[Candida] arabinofermentans NRRL YB-2248 TaxID=983967 RepID=A0A1E4SWT7_9ASCO|nr:hypothetical protein CANARDRAFT_29652 [[Candida] arabinofermentans NRRL YB-2248]
MIPLSHLIFLLLHSKQETGIEFDFCLLFLEIEELELECELELELIESLGFEKEESKFLLDFIAID